MEVSAPAGDWPPNRPTDPDLSQEVLQDLYRYPRKNPALAWLLWLFTGFLGGHRFYLERLGSGIIMLFTSGGLFIWWLLDIRKVNGMVREYNDEQDRREAEGLPPLALAFMPSMDPALLEGPPYWAPARSGRFRLLGDAFVLAIAGFLLGTFSSHSDNYEGVLAILVLVAVTVMGARWEAMARKPLFRALDRWSHRLRIYYRINDPGSTLSLLFRPVVGTFSAFFSQKARAEVRIYLQLGAVFVVFFTLVDLSKVMVESGTEWGDLVGGMAREMAETFVIIYAFASPVGATLTTHLLLHRTDVTLWILSGITVAALAMGLWS